jgi:tRNA threonylcarbamoyladenosine biosynthesis protein TsaB
VIVLALDTTTRAGSCALLRDGDEMREVAGDPGSSHAARLPGDLMALLSQANVALADVDAFAVATGPGSFTGLRVGIAAMQGLAFATGKPLVGVTSFDALASAVRGDANRPLATWIDAWRGEVFTALYRAGVQVESPRVEPPLAALARLDGETPLFAGDGAAAHAQAIRSASPGAAFADPLAPPLAASVARLAAAAVRQGDRPSPDLIRPLYVRRSDAELARDASAAR